jgi:hypothetical protein
VKRLVACVSLVALASTAAAATSSHHARAGAGSAGKGRAARKVVATKAPCRVAPADEYFGRLKMSILGIRNTIKDQGLRVDVDSTKANSTLGTIALTEDAMHDWEHKYPCDSWLPSTIYALEHFYGKIHTAFGVRRVHYVYAWLRRDYPKSSILRIALRENGEAGVTPREPLANVNPH